MKPTGSHSALAPNFSISPATPRKLAALRYSPLIAAAFQLGVVKDYQLDRLRAFLDRENTPADVRYNLDQAEIAADQRTPIGWYPQVMGTDRVQRETDKLAGRVARLFVHGHSRWEARFLRAGETE